MTTMAVECDPGYGRTDELARLRSQTIWQMLSRVAQRGPQRNALIAANDAGEVQRLSYGGGFASACVTCLQVSRASACDAATASCSG